MKLFNKIATIMLAICLTFSLVVLTACDKEETTYYVYKSAEMETDFKFSNSFEHNDIASDVERNVNASLILDAQEKDAEFVETKAKLTEKKFSWFTSDVNFEYSLKSSSSDKKYVNEVDEEMVDSLENMLARYGATIDAMTFYVEKEDNSLELCVEISATQTLMEGISISAEYDVEYTFKKITKPDSIQGESKKLATYNYKGLALMVEAEVKNAEQLQQPLALKDEVESPANTTMANVITTYNANYKKAKLSVFEDKVVLGNAGIRSTYLIEETIENEKELSNAPKGIVESIKEVLLDRKIKGSNITIKECEVKIVESGKTCQFVMDFETSISVVYESKIVSVNLDFEFTINLQK